jgi:LDH2 family malate/lactate/ureidoglycolate dehydrogenase
MAGNPDQILVGHEEAKAFVVALLEASGVSKSNAEIVAEGLVQADMRGVESHGINRIPSYLARIRNGVLDPSAEPTLKQVTPVVAQVSQNRPPLRCKEQVS